MEHSFGNKASWDRPFEQWFRIFVEEANAAVFSNGHENKATHGGILTLTGQYDLIYIDPPYITGRGVALDYRDFYHFLEGLTQYDTWAEQIDYNSKHLRLKRQPNIWTDKQAITAAFDQLFARFQDSIILVSYRSDGIPGESTLVYLLEKYKQNVRVEHYGQYKYALSKNSRSQELLLIGT